MSRKDLLSSSSGHLLTEFLKAGIAKDSETRAEETKASPAEAAEALYDVTLSDEDRPYETLVLMGEIGCNFIDAQNPNHADLVDHEYDHNPETGCYEIFFAPVEGLSRTEQLIAQDMIGEFLEKLEELADPDNAFVYPALGVIGGRCKMEILDMLMEYNQKYEAPLVNLCDTQIAKNMEPGEFMELLNRAKDIAQRFLEKYPEHEQDLLKTSYARPYLSLSDYHGNAQMVYSNASPRQITLSTMFILIDEKIKLIDRDQPGMTKYTLRPGFILN